MRARRRQVSPSCLVNSMVDSKPSLGNLRIDQTFNMHSRQRTGATKPGSLEQKRMQARSPLACVNQGTGAMASSRFCECRSFVSAARCGCRVPDQQNCLCSIQARVYGRLYMHQTRRAECMRMRRPGRPGGQKKNDNEEEEKQEYDCISWRWSKGVVGSEILCMLDRIHLQLVHAPVHLGQE